MALGTKTIAAAPRFPPPPLAPIRRKAMIPPVPPLPLTVNTNVVVAGQPPRRSLSRQSTASIGTLERENPPAEARSVP